MDSLSSNRHQLVHGLIWNIVMASLFILTLFFFMSFISELVISMITWTMNTTIFGSCVTWTICPIIGTNLSMSLYGALQCMASFLDINMSCCSCFSLTSNHYDHLPHKQAIFGSCDINYVEGLSN